MNFLYQCSVRFKTFIKAFSHGSKKVIRQADVDNPITVRGRMIVKQTTERNQNRFLEKLERLRVIFLRKIADLTGPTEKMKL